jgi:heme-degrading monooxygenase HmoA
VIAVIFEVTPVYGRRSTYLDIAAQLHARLDKIDGFLSIERFESLKMPGKILSLSFWRDEEAIARWRNGQEHRAAQQAGRNGIFADYRLRIAGVVRDYGMAERDEAPQDSRVFHETRGRP